MTDDDLILAAQRVAGEFRTSHACVAGGVVAALLTRQGHLCTGICVDMLPLDWSGVPGSPLAEYR